MPVQRNIILFGGFYSPPFMYSNQGQNLYGPLIDLTQVLARSFAYTPIYRHMSQEELNKFDKSNIDIGLGVFETQYRKVLGSFSIPLFQFSLQGLGCQDYRFLAVNELRTKSIRCGVKEGEIGHDFLISQFGIDWVNKYCAIIPASSPKDSWMLLEELECDVVICDTLTLVNRKSAVAKPTWLAFKKPILKINMGFLVNKKSPMSVTEVNKWVTNYSKTTGYREFLKSVYKENETSFKPA